MATSQPAAKPDKRAARAARSAPKQVRCPNRSGHHSQRAFPDKVQAGTVTGNAVLACEIPNDTRVLASLKQLRYSKGKPWMQVARGAKSAAKSAQSTAEKAEKKTGGLLKSLGFGQGTVYADDE